MSNFLTRTLSGAVYVGLVVASILVHPVFFFVLFLLFSMYAVWEFHTLMQSPLMIRVLSVLMGGLLFYLTWLIFRGYSAEVCGGVFMTELLLLFFTLISVLFIRPTQEKPVNAVLLWGNILGSLIMIALPFAMMNILMYHNTYKNDMAAFRLLALFITIWVNDSGAYCVGSLTAKRAGGNHKMFPRVSPAKSWEGLFGGIAFSLLAGVIFWKVGWLPGCWAALVYTLVISVFGTLGDLMESLMKRTIGVKDSGRFLPGHGGILDRFDSVLLAVPAATIFMFIFLI